MALFALYLGVNVALSFFFEKRKWKIATTAHAVLFSVLLVDVAILYGGGLVEGVLLQIISKTVLLSIREALLSGTTYFMAPAVFLEVVMIVTSVAIGICSAASVVSRTFFKRSPYEHREKHGNAPDVTEELALRLPPIYFTRIYCVMLC